VLAIALVSGGLDSILAAKVVEGLGIKVLPVHFQIPFCHRNKLSFNFGPGLKNIILGEDFLDVIRRPRHGFGANLNPCIDCKILMLKRAKVLMQELGAKFIVTGEVLAQRPMSQHRKALLTIEKESGLEGLLLRPLSAQLLEETIPEKEGWVDRAKLLRFNGRSRKPQVELAKSLNIQNYAQPAGGCLLTDPEFSKRLKDLITHKELNLANVELLKIGRHFRLTDQAKLVVSRDELEGLALEANALSSDLIFKPPQEICGPTALGRGKFDEQLILMANAIVSSYSDRPDKEPRDNFARFRI